MSKIKTRKALPRKEKVHYPLILIVWDDHTSLDDWVDLKDMDEMLRKATIHSIGWLIKEDDVSYTIAAGIELETGCTTSLQYILKGTVVSKKVMAK
jgi:hypothetical protein